MLCLAVDGHLFLVNIDYQSGKLSIHSMAQMKRPGGMREAIKLILIN